MAILFNITPQAATQAAEHSDPNAKPKQTQWGTPLLLKGKSWFQVRSGPEVTAFKTELNQIVDAARGFIKDNAATGAGMEAALKGLDAFESGKINCCAPSRAMVTFGANRQNLARFMALLNDNSIPMDVRCGAAVELFGSLGTCPEGEALRIEEQTAKLGNYGKGLGTRYKETKEQLIDQALTQLVRQEYSWQSNIDELEIHHVNALKNLHSGEWGLKYREDRYSRSMVQEQCGAMAKTLVDATVTHHKVSRVLAEQIRDVCMGNLGVPDGFADDGGPTFNYQQGKVDLLDSCLKAEFGDSIQLHDLLEFSDDYTEVTLKGSDDIQRTVLEKMQKEGVLKTENPISKWMQEEAPSVSDTLRIMNQQLLSRGLVSPARQHSHNLASTYGLGLTGVIPAGGTDTRKKDEEERRLRAAQGFAGVPGAKPAVRVASTEPGLAPPHAQRSQAPALGPEWSAPESKNPAG